MQVAPTFYFIPSTLYSAKSVEAFSKGMVQEKEEIIKFKKEKAQHHCYAL